MHKICWIACLYHLLIVGTSCQKQVTITQKHTIERTTGNNVQLKSEIEAAAIEETIQELEQQGLIK